MKILSNSGGERVFDLVRPQMRQGHHLDAVTPALSLFAYSELMSELTPSCSLADACRSISVRAR